MLYRDSTGRRDKRMLVETLKERGDYIGVRFGVSRSSREEAAQMIALLSTQLLDSLRGSQRPRWPRKHPTSS